jgi:hypothetical protein
MIFCQRGKSAKGLAQPLLVPKTLTDLLSPPYSVQLLKEIEMAQPPIKLSLWEKITMFCIFGLTGKLTFLKTEAC